MIDLNQFSLDGKVALVTGASKGIGEATALAFAKAGADVVLASRKLADLEQVAAKINTLGRKSLPVATHVGHIEQLKPLVDAAVAKFGRIDILVNNAGTNPVATTVLELEEKAWDVVMNLNLKGLFFLSQAVARVMKDNGGGKIINVSSVDAFTPEYLIGAYSISKAAVVMATKVFARELAKYNIRVNCIAPGAVSTKTRESSWVSDPAAKEDFLKRKIMGRIGEPNEIAGGMIYLASDASSYVTGQTFVIDGGELIT